MFFLDAYPTQHLIFNWKSPSLVVLDKEMAQFYMNEMITISYIYGKKGVETRN